MSSKKNNIKAVCIISTKYLTGEISNIGIFKIVNFR